MIITTNAGSMANSSNGESSGSVDLLPPGIIGQSYHKLSLRLLSSPWWIRIALIYLVSRLVSWAIFEAAAKQQGVSPWGPASPDYLSFVNFWDSEWYLKIFSGGYPIQLPVSDSGAVSQNPWAFYPVFPGLVRALNLATGISWQLLAPTVAVLAGLAASLMIYKLFRLKASIRTSSWGVAFVVFSPISAILQVPYAESTNLFFLALALYLVIKGQYFWALPVIILSDLSRPVGSAFACFALLHVAYQLCPESWKEWGQISQWKQRWAALTALRICGLLLLAIVSVVGAALWPLIASWVTGRPDAYMETETAWRFGPLILFLPWLDSAQLLFGPIFGPIALVVLLAAVVALMFAPSVRRIGIDLRLWCASYMLYLFAVLNPWTSTFRLLLPLFPLALGVAGASRSTAYRWSMLAWMVALQVVWVVWLWCWAQLPGGGDYPP